MTKLAFLDTETTGLDPDKHEIWEVGLIIRDGDSSGEEYVWQFPITEIDADPFALEVGYYWERRWDTRSTEISTHDAIFKANSPSARRKNYRDQGLAIDRSPEWCRHFAHLTAGAHLVGAVVSFDEERLRRLLRSRGVVPRWHYHMVDVEALAAGLTRSPPPWNSEGLSRLVGIEPNDFDRHTALGDARWARALYDHVMMV